MSDINYQGQSTQELIEYTESLQSKLVESESKISVLSIQLLKAEEQVRIYKEKLDAYKNQTFGSKREKIQLGKLAYLTR